MRFLRKGIQMPINYAADYRYDNAGCSGVHAYVLPALEAELRFLGIKPSRFFDLGCGNGSVANWLASHGHEVHGVDPSHAGIENARRAYPALDLQIGSAYDSLHEKFGLFSAVVASRSLSTFTPRESMQPPSEIYLFQAVTDLSQPHIMVISRI
jgi:SAM-dependent methyltransferase